MTVYQRYRTKALLAVGTAGVTLMPYVSAGTLNDSVYPLITDVSELFTPILTLVIAAVPVIVATGMIGFILGVLAAILQKMHL